jgi:hypothetical protein
MIKRNREKRIWVYKTAIGTGRITRKEKLSMDLISIPTRKNKAPMIQLGKR